MCVLEPPAHVVVTSCFLCGVLPGHVLGLWQLTFVIVLLRQRQGGVRAGAGTHAAVVGGPARVWRDRMRQRHRGTLMWSSFNPFFCVGGGGCLHLWEGFSALSTWLVAPPPPSPPSPPAVSYSGHQSAPAGLLDLSPRLKNPAWAGGSCLTCISALEQLLVDIWSPRMPRWIDLDCTGGMSVDFAQVCVCVCLFVFPLNGGFRSGQVKIHIFWIRKWTLPH